MGKLKYPLIEARQAYVKKDEKYTKYISIESIYAGTGDYENVDINQMKKMPPWNTRYAESKNRAPIAHIVETYLYNNGGLEQYESNEYCRPNITKKLNGAILIKPEEREEHLERIKEFCKSYYKLKCDEAICNTMWY